MADRTRSQKRQQRSDAREERRSLAAKPFEALDEAAGSEGGESRARRTLKQSATTAAAGAVAAGIAGAAKALADRRGEEPQRATQPDPEPRADVGGGEPDESEPQAERRDEQGEAEPEGEADPEAEEAYEPDEGQDDEQDEPAGGSGDGAPQGASPDEMKAIVDEAKQKLQELMGTEPERVSGFERSDGRWTVTLEVVNLRRIPDTTDVLSSYEVTFDDDHNLVSLSETRRYRRSQVEEGR